MEFVYWFCGITKGILYLGCEENKANRVDPHPKKCDLELREAQRQVIPLSKTKETNVLFAGFRKMRYAESFECWALS